MEEEQIESWELITKEDIQEFIESRAKRSSANPVEIFTLLDRDIIKYVTHMYGGDEQAAAHHLEINTDTVRKYAPEMIENQHKMSKNKIKILKLVFPAFDYNIRIFDEIELFQTYGRTRTIQRKNDPSPVTSRHESRGKGISSKQVGLLVKQGVLELPEGYSCYTPGIELQNRVLHRWDMTRDVEDIATKLNLSQRRVVGILNMNYIDSTSKNYAELSRSYAEICEKYTSAVNEFRSRKEKYIPPKVASQNEYNIPSLVGIIRSEITGNVPTNEKDKVYMELTDRKEIRELVYKHCNYINHGKYIDFLLDDPIGKSIFFQGMTVKKSTLLAVSERLPEIVPKLDMILDMLNKELRHK